MVIHVTRSIPAVVVLAATLTLSLGSRDEVVSSSAEYSHLSLLQRQSTRLGKEKTSSSDLANVNPASKVVCIKTHYTGSETLTGIFLRYCDNHNLSCAHVDNQQTMGKPELHRYAMEHSGENLDIWPWHVEYDPEAFHKLIPGALTVSMFREPKTRIKSGFSHLQSSAQKVYHRLYSLQRNEHLGCSAQMRSQVETLSYLDVVLTTEDYDRGLVLLAKKLGWPLQDMLYRPSHESKNMNLTQDHLQALDEFFAYIEQPSERLTQAARAWKHECFEVDGRLYAEANKTYHEQLENLTREERQEVERGVDRLQRANKALADCCTRLPLDLYCYAMHESGYGWSVRTAQGLPPRDHANTMSACHIAALQVLDG